MSERGKEWLAFSAMVLSHIENYTVPQYGDKGEDLATEYTPEYCVSQVEKYAKRYGKNQRYGQEISDIIKMAHYAQMAHAKLTGVQVNAAEVLPTIFGDAGRVIPSYPVRLQPMSGNTRDRYEDRLQIAIAAMGPLITIAIRGVEYSEGKTLQRVARSSFSMADAMLEKADEKI